MHSPRDASRQSRICGWPPAPDESFLAVRARLLEVGLLSLTGRASMKVGFTRQTHRRRIDPELRRRLIGTTLSLAGWAGRSLRPASGLANQPSFHSGRESRPNHDVVCLKLRTH